MAKRRGDAAGAARRSLSADPRSMPHRRRRGHNHRSDPVEDAAMEQIFEISGMHCGGCVNRVTRALKELVDDVVVTLDPPRATLNVAAPVSLQAVRQAVAGAGDYEVTPLS
jgi:copper chaperone CopZ